MKYTVYLAGPISGLSYDGAVNWRDEVAAALDSDKVECLSPMRGKYHLKGTTQLAAQGYGNPMSTNRGIMHRDHFDCTRATLLFVNFLGAEKPSLGTAMECAWAYDRHIPVILVMGETNPHRHAMILETATYIVPSVEEGVRLAQVLLNDFADAEEAYQEAQ